MNPHHIGTSFEDFLAAEDMLEKATVIAMKRVIVWQIKSEMLSQNITKTNMAKRMQTSRASLNRLLDENNPHLKLITLAKAATADC
jgi:DNA-binding Xre family transcriptional regulator